MLNKDVLHEVDEAARRQARGLIRTARYGALAVISPQTGVPLASRVSVATDVPGHPVILISQLSAHFGALEADPRCSILLGEPGRGDPLAHPRISVTARAERTVEVRERFLRRHPKAALYADFPDFAFWRLNVTGASLNAGFGKAYAMSREDLLTGDLTSESEAVAHMNEDHRDAVATYATGLCGAEPGEWSLTGLDPDGIDLCLGDRVERIWFDPPLRGPGDIRPRLVSLVKAARGE